MEDIKKFLKDSNLGGWLWAIPAVVVLSFLSTSYNNYLNIKINKQRLKLNEYELAEKETLIG